MIVFVLTAVLAQSGEALVRHDFRGVSLKAPKSWEVSTEDESGKEWATGDERAQMAFSAFPVEPLRPPRSCVKQLIAAIEAGATPPDAGAPVTLGFSNTLVGGQPAAKRITTDFVAEKEEDKTDANKVTTTTLVGCNGKTKWLLTFTNRTTDGAKSGALLRRVIDSLTYSK